MIICTMHAYVHHSIIQSLSPSIRHNGLQRVMRLQIRQFYEYVILVQFKFKFKANTLFPLIQDKAYIEDVAITLQ